MADDSKDRPDQGSAMPLRDDRHEVEIVHVPGDRNPVLGRSYGPDEVDVRLSSNLHWNGGLRPPRSTSDPDAAPIRQALDVRQRTILSYKLSSGNRARVNRAQTGLSNEGRKTVAESSERIDVKIRD